MKKLFKRISILFALALLLGAFGLGAAPAFQAAQVQPALAEMAASSPDQTVRVMVAARGERAELAAQVESLGGEVVKDLHIINALAAEMPAGAAAELARDASVAWLSLDGPVVSSGKPGGKGGGSTTTTTVHVRDEFSTPAYNHNDGTINWLSPWREFDDDGLPSSGQIRVDGSQRLLLDNTDGGLPESVTRSLDLSGASNAVLTFNYDASGGSLSDDYSLGMDTFTVEASSDGVNFSTIAQIPVFGSVSGSQSYTLDNHITLTDKTAIRFRLLLGFSAPGQFVAVDNVQVQFNLTVPGLPPNFYLDTLGVRDAWAKGYTGAGIGVAVIDSGVSQDRDFNSLTRMSFNTNSSTVNDVFGHGTHVAGIIAGDGVDSGGQYKGVAPDVDLISLKISDENGMAYESDTVDALQWVLDNKDAYNIRVVNLSIQSAVEVSYHNSPLAAATEILWFNGLVVVAATGNWDGGPVYPLNAPPGNDPFVITVGATDEKGTARANDDSWLTSSVFGATQDGFTKPEIWAPGKDIYSVLSNHSNWASQYPDRVVTVGGSPQYFRISGTSMATPMVSGAVALLLQAEPNLTPDQVKYRVTSATNWVSGMPYLSVEKMLTTSTTESANTGIRASQLLWTGDDPVTWNSVNWNSVNWNSVNWNSVNWNSVNWNSVNWNSLDWTE